MQIYIVKVHKIIFPLGSDVGLMSLDDHLLSVHFCQLIQCCRVIKLVGAGGGGINGKPGSLQQVPPLLFSPRASLRFLLSP